MAHGTPRYNICTACHHYITVSRFSPDPVCPVCGITSKQTSHSEIITNYQISILDELSNSFTIWTKLKPKIQTEK